MKKLIQIYHINLGVVLYQFIKQKNTDMYNSYKYTNYSQYNVYIQ